MTLLPSSEYHNHSDLMSTSVNGPKNGEQEPVADLDATREVAADTPSAFSNNNNIGKSNIDMINDPNDLKSRVYHTGWRLHALTAA